VFAVGIAALSALVWGSADFCGGKATRRGGALAVTVVSQIFGLPMLLVCVLLLPGYGAYDNITWRVEGGTVTLGGITGKATLMVSRIKWKEGWPQPIRLP